MSVTLLKRPTFAPAAPLLDVPQLDDALDAGIDSVIAQAAASTRTKRVKADGRRDFRQSHTARAWTRGGQVD